MQVPVAVASSAKGKASPATGNKPGTKIAASKAKPVAPVATAAEIAAAKKIQAAARGFLTRKHVKCAILLALLVLELCALDV